MKLLFVEHANFPRYWIPPRVGVVMIDSSIFACCRRCRYGARGDVVVVAAVAPMVVVEDAPAEVLVAVPARIPVQLDSDDC